MVQELRETVAAATELVAEIVLRFKAGDPANELLGRLDSVLETLALQTACESEELPADLRDEITRLLALVQAAVATGDEWLGRTEPELTSQHARQRLQRAYGVP